MHRLRQTTTTTVLKKQQSVCKSLPDASHRVSSTEQRCQMITKYSMEWGRSGEHCLSKVLRCSSRQNSLLQTALCRTQKRKRYQPVTTYYRNWQTLLWGTDSSTIKTSSLVLCYSSLSVIIIQT